MRQASPQQRGANRGNAPTRQAALPVLETVARSAMPWGVGEMFMQVTAPAISHIVHHRLVESSRHQYKQ